MDEVQPRRPAQMPQAPKVARRDDITVRSQHVPLELLEIRDWRLRSALQSLISNLHSLYWGETARPSNSCASQAAMNVAQSTSYSYGRCQLLLVGPSTSRMTTTSALNPITTTAWSLPSTVWRVRPSGMRQIAGRQTLKSTVVLIQTSAPARKAVSTAPRSWAGVTRSP